MINASTRTRSPASNLADRKCVKGGVQTLVYDKPAGASDAFEPKSKGAPKTFRRSFFAEWRRLSVRDKSNSVLKF